MFTQLLEALLTLPGSAVSFLISLSREWDMPEFSMLRVSPHRHLALLKNVIDYSFRW